MTGNSAILETRDLVVKRGGTTILSVDTLALSPVEVLSVIGPNGAGKTTLLQVLAGLVRPLRGEILFQGASVRGESNLAYRRRISMVFQEPLLFDTTVFGNVASGLKIRGMLRQVIAERTTRQLNRFGISHLADRSAWTLSCGEAQRTSLARAFAVNPEILFLDEPFASLDPPTWEELIEDLNRALRETGTTALMATHDRGEALRLSDRIAVMNDGMIVQVGSPKEVMNRPVDEFIAAFVGMETILKGAVKESGGMGAFIMYVSFSDRTDSQAIEAVGNIPAGDEVVIVVRPENVTRTLPADDSGRTSARNVFTVRIAKIIKMGLYYKVSLDCGFPLSSFVTLHALEQLKLQEGSAVVASFKAMAVQVVRSNKPVDTAALRT